MALASGIFGKKVGTMGNRMLLWAFTGYSVLGAAVLGLIGWLFSSIFATGATIDGIALISVLSLLFRDVVSKMGDCVRGMNGQKVPDQAAPEMRDMGDVGRNV
jgi:hypothetical protein